MQSGWGRGLSRWVGLLCVLWSFPVGAQDLMDGTQAPPSGFELDLLGSAELRSGNVRLTSVSEQMLARYRTAAHEVSLLGTHAFGAQGGARFLNAVRGLAQYRYDVLRGVLGGLGPELILHYDRDEFRRREHLVNAGLGPYLRLLDGPSVRWTVTTAWVLEYEKFAKLTSESNPGQVVRDSEFGFTSQRAWLATEFGWEISERFHVGKSLIFQVPLDHCPCDTRVISTTSLRVYGNDYLGLQTALTLLYDSRPAIGVKSFDGIVRSSLVLSL